jgi:hypothetical protein
LAEVAALARQITAQTFAVEAARKSLEQTLRANGQALTLYNYLKKRATNAELFGWLLGQLKALHYQAYDAVVSLCLSARASLSAETGNYDTVEALPQVWLDNRHGLTAGEHCANTCCAWTACTCKAMSAVWSGSRPFRCDACSMTGKIRSRDFRLDPGTEELTDKGTLEFQLTQLSFDRDHPGEYCRLINLVEVDRPDCSALIRMYRRRCCRSAA